MQADPLIPLPAAGSVAGNLWTGGPLPAVDDSRVPGRRFPAVRALSSPGDADWRTAPVALQGQVTLATTFGAALLDIARRPEVHLVLESGTWYGGGSSWCIAQGLRSQITDVARPDRWLFTLEIFAPAHEYAASTLTRLPVTAMRGGSVGLEGYLPASDLSPSDTAGEQGTHFALYYERDKALAASAPKLLPALCAAYDFDFVLLDGNEYTGWAEFSLVETQCRPRYLALHDCGTLKTRKVQAHLAAHPERWRKIAEGSDAAAWAIFEAL